MIVQHGMMIIQLVWLGVVSGRIAATARLSAGLATNRHAVYTAVLGMHIAMIFPAVIKPLVKRLLAAEAYGIVNLRLAMTLIVLINHLAKHLLDAEAYGMKVVAVLVMIVQHGKVIIRVA